MRWSQERSRLRAIGFDPTRAVHIVLHEQNFSRVLPRRYRRIYLTLPFVTVRCRFADKCRNMRLNRKLLFNIRISTEDEINGTVKGVV